MRVEAGRRLLSVLPGFEGWTPAAGDEGALVFENRFDGGIGADNRLLLEFRPATGVAAMSRWIRVGREPRWLLLYASRDANPQNSTATEIVVRLDGKDISKRDVPMRHGDDGHRTAHRAAAGRRR